VLQVALVKMPEPLDDADAVDSLGSKGKKTTAKDKPVQAH